MGEVSETRAVADAKMPEKVRQVLDIVSEMTLIEAAELVKAFEEKFGVSAAPMVAAVPMAAAAGGEGAAVAEEKTEFTVVLAEVGPNKLQVIKTVREFTTLGLKEAKALVDEAPNPVREAVSKEEAEKIKTKLEEVGAKVELK